MAKTLHCPLAKMNALIVNTQIYKETSHVFSLQKKKLELLWADCTNLSIILFQIRGWLGRMWWGWTRNMSLVPFLGIAHLSDEQILSIYWCSYHIQSCIVAFLVETATKLLNFATQQGLAW